MIYLFLLFFIIFSIPISFSVSHKLTNKSLRLLDNSIYYSIAVIFILLGGMRWLTGTDWNPYYLYFQKHVTIKSFISQKFEIGYSIFNYIIKKHTDSYSVFLLFFHFFVILPKIIVIKNKSLYPIISIFLYYCIYLGEIVAVRNALGVSILLLSIDSIHNKRKKSFLFFVLLATSFHYSCAFWVFSYYIYHHDFSKKEWIILYSFSIILLFSGSIVYPMVINFIFKPIEETAIIFHKIIFYANDYNEITATFTKKMLSILKRAFILPFFFLFYNKMALKSVFNKGLLNLYIFGNAIYFMFFNSFQQMHRLLISHLFLEVILLPSFIVCVRSKVLKTLIILLICFYGTLKLVTLITPFRDLLIPYYSFFNFEYRSMY